MSDLDLDIENYSIIDLEKFFKLNPKSNYTASDIELKEYEIREQLLSSGHVDKKMKRNLIEFLTKGKQLLTYRKFGTTDLEPARQKQYEYTVPSQITRVS